MSALYTCSLCKKQFKRKWDLQRHHSRKKPCKKVIPKSSKIFQEPSKIFQNLSNSSKKSESGKTNEKRYGCDFCKRSYKHNYNLTKHLKTCKEKQKEEEKQELDLVNAKIRLLELMTANNI